MKDEVCRIGHCGRCAAIGGRDCSVAVTDARSALHTGDGDDGSSDSNDQHGRHYFDTGDGNNTEPDYVTNNDGNSDDDNSNVDRNHQNYIYTNNLENNYKNADNFD